MWPIRVFCPPGRDGVPQGAPYDAPRSDHVQRSSVTMQSFSHLLLTVLMFEPEPPLWMARVFFVKFLIYLEKKIFTSIRARENLTQMKVLDSMRERIATDQSFFFLGEIFF